MFNKIVVLAPDKVSTPLKSGPFPWSSVIQGGGSIVGSLINGIFGSNDQKNAIRAQAQMQEDAQQWQTAMSHDAQAFNAAEAQKNRDFQEKMVNQQNEWNSLSAQVKRAQAAGVNPFAMISPSGSSAASSPSGATASSGGWPSVSWAPNYSAQSMQARAGMVNAITGTIGTISEVLKNLSEAKQNGVRTEYYQKSMDDALALLKNNADGQKLINDINQVTKDFAPKLKQAEFEQLMSNIGLLGSQTDLNRTKISEIFQNIRESISRMGLNDAKTREVNKFVDNYEDKYYKSLINKNNQDANLAREQASTQPYVRQELGSRSSLQGAQEKLVNLNRDRAQIEYDIANETKPERKRALVEGYIAAADQAGINVETARVYLDKAKKENNTFYLRMAVELITSAVNSASGLINAVKPYPSPSSDPANSSSNPYYQYYDSSGNYIGVH